MAKTSVSSLSRVRNRARSTHHLLGNVDLFLQCHDTLVDGTRNINLGKIVAQVRLLFDQSDKAIFDLEEDGSAWFDILGKGAVGGDGQFLTSACIVSLDLSISTASVETYGRGGLGLRST